METGHEKGGAPCGRALQSPQHCRATQSRLAPAFAIALFLHCVLTKYYVAYNRDCNRSDVKFLVEYPFSYLLSLKLV